MEQTAAPATPAATGPLSSLQVKIVSDGKEARKVREVLNLRSRLHPLLPTRLGDGMTILDAQFEPTVKVRIQVLWGERKRIVSTGPLQSDRPDETRQNSLWDMPSSPPGDFNHFRESQRVPGEESLVDCAACQALGKTPCAQCHGEGQIACRYCKGENQDGSCKRCQGGKMPCGCSSGFNECGACGGKGKQLQFHFCQTVYTPAKFHEDEHSGELPAELIAAASGKKSYGGSFSALQGNQVGFGHEKRCFEVASRWIHSPYLSERLKLFFKLDPLQSPIITGEMVERRLIRAKMEFFYVPVLHLKCSLPGAKGLDPSSRFEAWLYDEDGKLHVTELPLRWTRKATAWVAGMIGLGLPLGYLLARWIIGLAG